MPAAVARASSAGDAAAADSGVTIAANVSRIQEYFMAITEQEFIPLCSSHEWDNVEIQRAKFPAETGAK